MSAILKTPLSQSSYGQAISVGATSSVGTLIHTANASATPGSGGTWDEIWLWGTNTSTSMIVLTVQFGATAASNSIILSIPAQGGETLIVPGHILQNSGTVHAYAGTSGFVTVQGYVNLITN